MLTPGSRPGELLERAGLHAFELTRIVKRVYSHARLINNAGTMEVTSKRFCILVETGLDTSAAALLLGCAIISLLIEISWLFNTREGRVVATPTFSGTRRRERECDT